MRSLYLEPFSGLSGDMLNGLLIDLGGDSTALERELSKLNISDYRLNIKRITKNSISGIDFDVKLIDIIKDRGIASDFMHKEKSLKHEHYHCDSSPQLRNLTDILNLINSSSLSKTVKQHSSNVFRDIAHAEAKVHNKSVEEIHFHEVGAVDSIIDIVSFFILWDQLEINRVYSSPITEGSGFIETAHGIMPVPVPAVTQLRKDTDLCIRQDFDTRTELVTPTGMAIFKELHPSFSLPEHHKINRVGYGFGKRDTGKFNALRGSLFRGVEDQMMSDKVIKIEANIDDQTPEQLGYIMKVLFDEGALDVFFTPIHMKKNRCGILLSVLCKPDRKEELIRILFAETTTIGVRYTLMERSIMKRKFSIKRTPYGKIRIKENYYGDLQKNTLEFEDCKQIARKYNLSIREVYKELEKYI